MTGSCVCGAVSITIKEKPEFINDCNCGLCRKVGAAWGYFPSSQVSISGKTVSFSRTDKEDPVVEIHSCEKCGAAAYFSLTTSFSEKNPKIDQIGANMKLFEPGDLEGVEIRFPNGIDWSGHGQFEYRRKAFTINADMPW